MARATVLIVDAIAGDFHAEALMRLGYPAERSTQLPDSGDMPEVVLLGAAEATSASDLRRSDPAVPILIALGDGDLDQAAGLLGFDNSAFLCPPWRLADYASALGAFRLDGLQRFGFAEEQSGYALRLAALGEEIARIARAIEPPASPEGAPPVPDAPLAFDPEQVRAVLKARRQRDALFPEGTFADPVWDMLLDLTAARGEGKPVSVSSLAIAAAVPTTTALRHLKAMADAGLVVRRPDPDDGRRAYIDLSDDAFARMRAWVAGTAKAV